MLIWEWHVELMSLCFAARHSNLVIEKCRASNICKQTLKRKHFLKNYVSFNVISNRVKWNVRAVLSLQLNKHVKKLLRLLHLNSLLSICITSSWGTSFFMSVMAFCWSCPFPSSNPGSNKRGLTSVTRAYKSPLLQMESAPESEVWRSVGRGGRGKVWKMGKLLEENNINARRCADGK